MNINIYTILQTNDFANIVSQLENVGGNNVEILKWEIILISKVDITYWHYR